jgi:hemolysin-activating ACP:hemolysin acyltransferase
MWGKRKCGSDEEGTAAGGASACPQVASADEQLLGTQSVAGVSQEPQPNGTEPSVTNGVGSTEAAALPNRAGRRPTADEVGFAVTFTRIVSVLSQSPHYKHYTLSDLEWLVVPPILTGQCAVMEATVNDHQVPVSAALWASVSEEVDKRLSESLLTPIRLRPDEWRSGEILWLIDAVGDPRAIPHLLRQLQETAFKERTAKIRTLGPDSRPVVTSLKATSTT